MGDLKMKNDFDQYICGLMSLDVNNSQDVDFYYKQLEKLKDCNHNIAVKAIIQHVVNLKFTQEQGLIK